MTAFWEFLLQPAVDVGLQTIVHAMDDDGFAFMDHEVDAFLGNRFKGTIQMQVERFDFQAGKQGFDLRLCIL